MKSKNTLQKIKQSFSANPSVYLDLLNTFYISSKQSDKVIHSDTFEFRDFFLSDEYAFADRCIRNGFSNGLKDFQLMRADYKNERLENVTLFQICSEITDAFCDFLAVYYPELYKSLTTSPVKKGVRFKGYKRLNRDKSIMQFISKRGYVADVLADRSGWSVSVSIGTTATLLDRIEFPLKTQLNEVIDWINSVKS